MIDIVFGTRPEAIKLAMLIKQLKEKNIPHRTISTGQHKEMLQQVLDWFEIVPQFELNLMSKNQSLSELSARAITSLQKFYDENGKPDVVCVQGDTTTAFIAGLVAFYNCIKVAHVEAGLRTNNKWSPFPEELNRRLLTELGDIHFAPTNIAYNVLLKEGKSKDNVFLTGNTVIDALLFSKSKIEKNNYYPVKLESFFTGIQKQNKVVLITGHRRENFGEGFINICTAIKELATSYTDIYFIYPVHLNPNVKDVVHEVLGSIPNVVLTDPLGYPDFIALMNRSFLILTDSGGVQEEAPSLKKPVLVMRSNTERMEGVNAGVVKLTGISPEKIISETEKLLNDADYYQTFLANENPYGTGDSSQKIISILLECVKK